MDEQNTDSDSHSVASNQSASSTSSKHKLGKDGSLRPSQTHAKRKQEEDGKVGSTPKRKKTDAPDPASSGAVTPSSTGTRKAAPLSERQQMVLALAMSAQESGGTSPVQTQSQPGVVTDTTPRSAMLRRVNRRNEKGESPLHLATIKGDVEAMTQLLEAGAGVNVPDYAGWTALHEACNHGFVSAARLLLEKGANVNAQGLDNDTPLHDAAINGHPELVSLLLNYGANPYQGNRKGESPIDVAINDDIKQLLRKEARVIAARTEPSERTTPTQDNMAAGKDDAMSLLHTEQSAAKADDSQDQVTDGSRLQSSAQAAIELAEIRPFSSNTSETADVAPPSSPSSTASSRPSASRHSSTGFVQEDCEEKADVPPVVAPESRTSSRLAMHSAFDESDRPTPATSQSPCRSPSTSESAAKPARQSLDFTPIKVLSPSPDSAMNNKPASSVESESLTAVSDSGIEGCKSESAVSAATSGESITESKSEEPLTSEPANNEPMDTTEQTTGGEVQGQFTDAPDEADKETEKLTETSKNDRITPEVDQRDERNPSAAPVQPAESKTVEQVKSDCKPLPVSPTLEKAQRTRTGSMHRKKRPAQSNTQPSSESPVQPDGDNSKDSTDSHVSTGNVTRASRSRNKQQQATNQPPDEEPIPVRETRRKTNMLKERSAASSPSVEKSSKAGSQKVPPLTIKLSVKPPGSNANASNTKEMSSSAPATASGEPYVMLADKETERANSALAKDQAKSRESPEASDNKDKKQDTTMILQSQSATQSNLSSTATAGVTTRRYLRSQANRNQGNVGDKPDDRLPPRKPKRARAEQVASAPSQAPSLPPPPGPLTIFNPYNLFKNVREQMFRKWEKIVSVNPRTPTGYSQYIINTKKYLLHKNATTNASKLAIPLLVAPSQLGQPMKELFNRQEQERYKLRHQHLIEGEKLRIAYEQEIVRVYTRGARAAVNQETPLSVCTILKDKESGTVYHPFNALKDGTSGQHPEEKTTEKSARSHFNNRQLISWLQDVEDKFEKLKDQMLSRHHHEAESLYAVQTMDWEWKLKELGLCEYKAQPTIEMLHVPMVPVNDDADILNSS